MNRFFLLFFLLVNCSFANGLIKIALVGKHENLNPIYNPNDAIVRLLYHGLFIEDDKKNLVPALVNSYNVNAKKTQYTFNLVTNLHFKKNTIDYGEFSSKDVKTTYEILKSKLFNPNHYKDYLNIKNIKIISDYEIEFELFKPDDDFLRKLTVGIMSKNALLKFGINYFNNDAIGIGFYELKKNLDDQLVLVRNLNSPIKVKNNGLMFKFYENYTQIKNAINNNSVDVGFIDYKNTKNLNIKTQILELKSTKHLGIELDNIKDENIKEIISFIICNEKIINPIQYLSKPNTNSQRICDREKAKNLLNQLGYFKDKKSISLDINSKGVKNFFKKNKENLKIYIFYDVLNKEYSEIIKIIARQLDDFGVETILKSINNVNINENKQYIKIITNLENINKENKHNSNDIFENTNKIFLALYKSYLAYNQDLKNIKEQVVKDGSNVFFTQAIDWYK